MTRKRGAFLAALLCASFFWMAGGMQTALFASAADTAVVYHYGDVDKSGSLEATDALAILRHVVGLEEFAADAADVRALADVTHDGEITAQDALYVLQAVVGLRETEAYLQDTQTEEPTSEAPEETASEEAIQTEEATPRPTRTPKPTDTPQPESGTLDVTDRNAWYLWEDAADVPYYDESIDQTIPRLVPYIASENETGICVIVIPGGGYSSENTTLSTATSVANALQEEGISAFALSYRTAPYTYKAIISDVLRAVRFVRYYHESLGIDPDKVIVMGFSAGGHLALMSMEHYADEDIALTGDAVDAWSAKPDGGVLGYAVVSLLEEYGHQTTRENFLGDEADDETLCARYSGELGVTEDTPPMFIWHCKPDRAVSYQSSEMLAQTLASYNVICELHIYESGEHGVGLATSYEEVSAWFPTCVSWLKETFGE